MNESYTDINDSDFDAYAVNMDSDCVTNDFDDYDLFGERMEESSDDFGDNLQFE